MGRSILAFIAILFTFHTVVVLVDSHRRHSDDYARMRTVKIINPEVGSCSGEQVKAPSGHDYILTAGHCKKLGGALGIFTIITEAGQTIQRRMIAEDPDSDLLLLEGVPELEGLEIARSVKKREHVRTFTHGKGLDTYLTEGNIIQDMGITVISGPVDDSELCNLPKNVILMHPFYGPVCGLQVVETVSTAMTVPGSSGGMALNSDNELVGVVSAGDDHFSLFVTLRDVHKFLAGY